MMKWRLLSFLYVRCFINASSLLNLYRPFLARHVRQPLGHTHTHRRAASSSHLTLTRSCQILTYHKWWTGCLQEELEFVVLGLCQCSRSWIERSASTKPSAHQLLSGLLAFLPNTHPNTLLSTPKSSHICRENKQKQVFYKLTFTEKSPFFST